MLAASLWGTIGLARSFLPGSVPAVAVAAARTAVGGALLLAFCCRPAEVGAVLADPVSRRRVLTAGVAMAAYQGLFFLALGRAGVATGVVVTMCTVPVFGGALEALSRRRRPGHRWAVSTGLAIGGCLLLAGGPAAAGARMVLGVLFGVAAGAAYIGFTAASSRAVTGGVRSSTVMAFAFGTAGLLLSPVLVVGQQGWLGTGRGIAVVGYLAVVATMGAYVAYGRGLRAVPLAHVGGLVLAEPVVAAVVGIVLLHEPCTARRALGLGLTAAALVVITAGHWRWPNRGPRHPDRGARLRCVARRRLGRAGPLAVIDGRGR